jgi:hypothetical protein
MAGPVCVEVLEERRLLSGAADAVAWDLTTPINAELAVEGEVDYYRFSAAAGEQIVFDSTGLKQMDILDSDAATKLSQVLILDGAGQNPAPGRVVWTAPHGGNFYVSVSGYFAFLIDAPTGPYSLSAYEVDATKRPEDGAMISAGQSVSGDLSGAGDIDYYSFDAKAGTIYRFTLTSEQAGGGVTAHYVMGVVEAQPWSPPPQQPSDALEAYPGHNIQFTNLDGQKALGNIAEWVAPTSGRFHFSIAPLDAQHAGAYTVAMSQRAFPCDPQTGNGGTSPTLQDGRNATSQNTQSKSSSHSARHQKPRKHHRRPAAHKHETPSAKQKLQSARQKLLSLAKD